MAAMYKSTYNFGETKFIAKVIPELAKPYYNFVKVMLACYLLWQYDEDCKELVFRYLVCRKREYQTSIVKHNSFVKQFNKMFSHKLLGMGEISSIGKEIMEILDFKKEDINGIKNFLTITIKTNFSLITGRDHDNIHFKHDCTQIDYKLLKETENGHCYFIIPEDNTHIYNLLVIDKSKKFVDLFAKVYLKKVFVLMETFCLFP